MSLDIGRGEFRPHLIWYGDHQIAFDWIARLPSVARVRCRVTPVCPAKAAQIVPVSKLVM